MTPSGHVPAQLTGQRHSTLDLVRRGENVLLRGQAGVGKTTLAQNLGLRALERGHTVRFCTLVRAGSRARVTSA
jgi:DNA replication protein DnaC